MSGLTVIDTNILDCLLHSMERGELPLTNDPALADEQVATFRLFLWSGFAVGMHDERLQYRDDRMRRFRHYTAADCRSNSQSAFYERVFVDVSTKAARAERSVRDGYFREPARNVSPCSVANRRSCDPFTSPLPE